MMKFCTHIFTSIVNNIGYLFLDSMDPLPFSIFNCKYSIKICPHEAVETARPAKPEIVESMKLIAHELRPETPGSESRHGQQEIKKLTMYII